MDHEMARLTDRPPPPPGSPFLPPPPRPQLPPPTTAVQQRAWAALALALLSLIAMALIGNIQRGIYVVAVALVVAMAALVLAITAMSAARKAGTRRPRGAVGGVVLGVTGTLFSGLALTGLLLFWSQLNQYANCINGAGTVATQQACKQQLNNSISAEMKVLGGG